jgi:hypothetical protein
VLVRERFGDLEVSDRAAHRLGVVAGEDLEADARLILVQTSVITSEGSGEQQLGLELSSETITNHFQATDGTTLLVYGRPSPNAADHTHTGLRLIRGRGKRD